MSTRIMGRVQGSALFYVKGELGTSTTSISRDELLPGDLTPFVDDEVFDTTGNVFIITKVSTDSVTVAYSTSIRGADGADGKDGENGADGKDGENGADGKDGENAAISLNVIDGDLWVYQSDILNMKEFSLEDGHLCLEVDDG